MNRETELIPWRVDLYADASGQSPVVAELAQLDVRDRARVARYLQLLQEFGTSLGMPDARHIRGPLWELRPGAYRILYAVMPLRRCVVLRVFRKKSRDTPRQEIAMAWRRLSDLPATDEEEGI